MIVLFKNGKITGAETKLLKMLNTDLAGLSSIISELEFLISSRQNNNISINNISFKVEEIPLISLEDITAFELIQDLTSTAKDQYQEPTISLENELLNLEPLNKEGNTQIKIEEPFIQEPMIPEDFNISIQQENIKPSSQTTSEISTSEIKHSHQNPEIKPVIAENEIKISFENTFDEINEILSLDKEEANKLIAEELQKASEDLGIDYQTINNLYIDLIKQFENEKKEFYQAINENNYEKLHQTAHKLKGAALNLRLSKLALILKNIDEESKANKPIEQIKFLVDKFYSFVEKIKNDSNDLEIPESIKNLILITIKDYLATQNEKKFKKDIKYIEKILNTKINSLEDLQKLVKE